MRLALIIAGALCALVAPGWAQGLPLDGTLRDEASCDALQSLNDATDLDDEARETLDRAVQDGVTLSAAQATGPGDWVCTFPQVWNAGNGANPDRWIALSACEADGEFFPALMTVERTGETFRLRLGDSADAVSMRACPITPIAEPDTQTEPQPNTP